MATATLAPVLVRGRADINARWPQRDRRSDGWIGDRAHQRQGSKSDHNPDPRGIVHALDIDADGIDTALLVAALCAHPSTQYVIYNRKIYSRSYGFRPRAYIGSNPHTSHIHWSIQHGSTWENHNSRLKLEPRLPAIIKVSNTTPTRSWSADLIKGMPLTRKGSKGRQVRRDQGLLTLYGHRLRIDGDFGTFTDRAVRNLQASRRLRVDGIVGINTRAAMLRGTTLSQLRRNNWGHYVSVFQVFATALGYPLAADGQYGPATERAARQIQARYGLAVDGVVGPQTWTVVCTR